MKKSVLRRAQKYLKVHKRQKRWHKVVTGLACVVVFCTTYALILPAITLEGKKCALPEHTHSDECYTQQTAAVHQMLDCTYEALGVHKHTEDCYNDEGVLTCEEVDYIVHTHDESCYDSEGNLVCQLPEIKAHTHDESCYTMPEPHAHGEECYKRERGALICVESTEPTEVSTGGGRLEGEKKLVCELPEDENHTHGEECYETVEAAEEAPTEAHVHTDECYEWNKVLICEKSTEPDPDAKPVLTCEKPEIIPHTHTEECYDKDGNRICGMQEILVHVHGPECFRQVEEALDTTALTCTRPEDETHTHSERCYGIWELTCGLEEHTHSLSCYADPEADVEEAEAWEASFAAVTGSGDWRKDAAAIAKTQLGYTESKENYIVLEDGENMKGYTRYGAWYGEPYEDWNALFTAFCLHYAGTEVMPEGGSTEALISTLGEYYVNPEGYVPQAGEVVFFDRDGDGRADQSGIVAEVTETVSQGTGEEVTETPETEEAAVPEGEITEAAQAAEWTLKVIAGDVAGEDGDAVRELMVSSEEAVGYGAPPKVAKPFTLTAQSEGGITVTITGMDSNLPCPVREVTVAVRELDENERQELDAQLSENGENQESEEEAPEVRYLLDVSLRRGETEIQPSGPVTVTFSGFETEGLYPQVYHIDTETNTATDMEAVTDEGGNISLETDHFSPFKVIMRTAPNGTRLSGQLYGSSFSGSGIFFLDGDAYISETVYVNNRNITLDLNGHGLYYQGGSNLFEVQNGGILTIRDSGAVDETVTTASGDQYERLATLEKNGNKPTKLTYYVTESTAAGIATTETLIRHDVVPKGFISAENGGAQSIVKVTGGGSFALEGGLLTNPYKRIVDNDHSTVTISGGYIAGGDVTGEKATDSWGGGIFNNNGTVTMTGGVIAANQAYSGGGIAMDGGSFTMSGGCISGNKCWAQGNFGQNGDGKYGQGGGVFGNGATIELSGSAYITNNRDEITCRDEKTGGCRGSGCHGGGGVATTFNSRITMSGGFVTGNYSKEAGGGLYVGHADGGSNWLTMTGGIVAANYSDTSEGGGIRISKGTNGIISASQYSKAYITNNTNNSDFDWGGGGIFVQEGGTLQLFNSLITNNSAGGFGGGVGACPSGNASIAGNNGAAVYGNTDQGAHMSGGGYGKNTDTEIANKSDVFKNNGHADVFWVKDDSHNGSMSVTGRMLGGSSARWQGSVDHTAVDYDSIGLDVKKTASTLLGMTADPDDDAKSKAQAAASVIISGNHSFTHGGGIMTNGSLIVGGKEMTPLPSLSITGTKALKINNISQDSGLNFHFELLNGTKERVVGTATADATTGAFSITPKESFSREGTYTFYLREVNDGRDGVEYDGKEYEIKVTIASRTHTEESTHTVYTTYYVQSVTVDGQTSGGGGDSNNKVVLHYDNSGTNWDSVNAYTWNDNGDLSGGWPGSPATRESGNWYRYDVPISCDTAFRFIFNNGSSQTGDLEKRGGISEVWYTGGAVHTAWQDGWPKADFGGGDTPITGSGFEGSLNDDGSYTVKLLGDTFTNTQEAPLCLTLIKTDRTTGDRLSGAKFRLKEANAEGDGEEKEIDANGVVTFADLKRNTTYYLWETKAPGHYMIGGPWILETDADGYGKLYQAREQEDGSLAKANDVFTSLTGEASGSEIQMKAEIPNELTTYTLPVTGGIGTNVYTVGGLLILMAAGLLGYCNVKRRKEDAASS